MPYKTWATNDVPSAADVNNITADAQTADVQTSESTTSTTYTDLATSGPAVTLSLVNGQGCLVWVACRISNSAGGPGHQSSMSFAVSGASTLTANDQNAIESQETQASPGERATWFVATATGSHTFTAKYKVSNGADTGTYVMRRIIVKKF